MRGIKEKIQIQLDREQRFLIQAKDEQYLQKFYIKKMLIADLIAKIYKRYQFIPSLLELNKTVIFRSKLIQNEDNFLPNNRQFEIQCILYNDNDALYIQSSYQNLRRLLKPNIKTLKKIICQQKDGDQPLSFLLEHKFQKLKFLNLNDKKLKYYTSSIGEDSIKLLVKCQMPNIKSINIVSSKIGNEGAKHLTKGNWPELQFLAFNPNKMSLDAYLSLAEGKWRQLLHILTKQYDQKCQIEPINQISYILMESPKFIIQRICQRKRGKNFPQNLITIIRQRNPLMFVEQQNIQDIMLKSWQQDRQHYEKQV